MKQVLVIRHAEAEDAVDAAHAGRQDKERRLTDSGKRDMREAAAGLAELVDRVSLILTSPLTRAVQTAELLHAAFPEAELRQHAFLAPGSDPGALLKSIAKQSGPLALVGHEPDLSRWVGFMCTGESRSVVRMKKGSVCRLDMPDPAAPGEAHIAWLITLKQLTRLG